MLPETLSDIHIYFVTEKQGKTVIEYRLLLITYLDLTFFFLVKGIRASVWKTRDIVIRGKNPTDISFAHIGNQVQFIDTIKYFQQSLAALANSLTISEKASIYEECKNYIKKDEELIKNFLLLSETDKEWVLDYLSSGKGTIHL